MYARMPMTNDARLLALFSLLLVILTGCSGDDDDATENPRAASPTTAATTATSVATDEPPSTTSPDGASPTTPSSPTSTEMATGTATVAASPTPTASPEIIGGLPTAVPATPTGEEYVKVGSWDLNVLGLGGIATGPEGNLHVIDYGTDRVLVFSPGGEPLASYAFLGELQMGFQQNDMAVAPSGEVAVLDQDLYRVLVFAPDGSLLAEWGGEVSFEPGTPFDARAIAIDADSRIYLADPTPRLQVFSRDGELLDVWEDIDGEPLPFAEVQDMEIVGDTLYLLGGTPDGMAIVSMTLDGALAGEPIVFTDDFETDLQPFSLAVRPDGGFVIADPLRLVVARVSADGSIEASWPIEKGTTGGWLEVAAGDDGRVYVADAGSGAMTLYAPTALAEDAPTVVASPEDSTAAIEVSPSSGDCAAEPTVTGSGFEPGTMVEIFISLGQTNFLVVARAIPVSDDRTFLAQEPFFDDLNCVQSGMELNVHAVAAPAADADQPSQTIASATYTVTP